jgi:hypothetical protein
MLHKQARQDSNLQPPVLGPTPSNAGVAAFVDFQGLSSDRATPALTLFLALSLVRRAPSPNTGPHRWTNR